MIRHTRQEAKALGLPRCYGSVCAKHPELEGERRISGACLACSRDHVNSSRAKNPEKTRQHRIKSQEKTAEKRTKMFGFAWEVDHIIPLQGDTVSGLHVPTNLQVIPRSVNRAKWNSYEVAF
jgi:hypothetical protein